jgi:thioredoxin-like negative regulator of GroEL
MRPMRILGGIALLLCAIAATAQTPNDDFYSRIKPLETSVASGTATRADQLQLARLYIQTSRFHEAAKLADGLLASDPSDAQALSLRDEAKRGERAVNDARVAEAEAATRKAGATDQDRRALADAYFDAASYAAAADTYAHLPPAAIDREVRLRWARALAWSNQLDASERVYSQVIREGNTPEVQAEYGKLLSWMGASHAAVDTLQKVYAQNRTEDNAIALANAMAWSGNREGAVKLLDDFAQSNAGASKAAQLAEQFRTSPDIRIERLDKMIDAEPYNLALQVEKARLQLDAGRYGESLRTVKFIREHSSRDIDGLDEIERAAKEGRTAELSKLEERRKVLDAQASMASSSQNADEILSLAKAYTGLGDYRSAERLYVRYLRLRPDDTEARIQYARVLSWDEKYPESERQYRMVLDRYPDRADLRLELAQIQSWSSEFAPAINTFRSLTDLSSNPRANLYTDVPPRAYYNLGQIYRWYGWNETAAYSQTQALALDGGYMPARRELDLVRHVRPTSTVDARVSYATDSNDFTMKRADIEAQKWTSQRTAFDLAVGRHEFEHHGEEVYANTISGGGRYRWSDRWTARARVGLNFYDSGLGTRPFFGVGAEWLPSVQSRAAFDFNHYDLVYDVFTLTSLGTPTGPTTVNLGNPLTINDFRGHYDYATGGHWSWLADGSYGFVSDDNKRAAAHGLLSFRIFKSPFLAIKADGRYLSYDFRTNRYWSPPDYKSLAGVLHIGQNVRNRFYWSLEAKAGRAWEQDHSSDLRSYEGTVTVPVSDAFDIVGNYGYGKSGRFDSISPVGSGSTDFVNYWQRHWYVGVRLKQLYARGDRPSRNPYYYDTRPLGGSSSVIPETH